MTIFNLKKEPCMKNVIRLVSVLPLFMALNAVVIATPSTQIWIPSTDIQPYLNPHFGWDSYINTDSVGPGTILNGGVTMGVLPFKKIQMEIGVDYRDINGNHVYPFYFNAKIGTPEDALFKYQPAVAFGGFDFGTKVNVTTYNVVYGLIAKNIWKLGRFSAGGFKGAVGVNPKKVFAALSDSAIVDDAGVLASWDRTMTEISGKLWLAVDYQSGKSGYGALSVGLSWSFSPNASVIFGYDFWNDSKALKPTATVQVDINAF